MKRIALLIIAVMLLLPCVVQADVAPHIIPDHLAFTICANGGESGQLVTVVGSKYGKLTCNATTTVVPFRWPEGPVVPNNLTIPLMQAQGFEVRVSSKDIYGNEWPVGYYSGNIKLCKDRYRQLEVPVDLSIADCTNNPPPLISPPPFPPPTPIQIRIPEFPVSPQHIINYISAGIVAAILGCIMVLGWGNH